MDIVTRAPRTFNINRCFRRCLAWRKFFGVRVIHSFESANLGSNLNGEAPQASVWLVFARALLVETWVSCGASAKNRRRISEELRLFPRREAKFWIMASCKAIKFQASLRNPPALLRARGVAARVA